MSTNLNLATMGTGDGKVLVHADNIGRLDRLLSESLEVDLSAGDVVLDEDETLSALTFVLVDATVVGRDVTLAAVRRFFLVDCDASCIEPVAVKIGSGSVTVNGGFTYLFWSNGTTNHIALVSTYDPDGFTTDGQIADAGTSGKLLKKSSGADYDYDWADDETGGALPAGGSATQVLVKQSSADFDVDWENPSGGGGAPWDFDPPDASYFGSNTGSGTGALTDDSDEGLLFDFGTWPNSTAISKIFYKNIANSTFTVVAHMKSNMRVGVANTMGICLFESGTNKRTLFGFAGSVGGSAQIGNGGYTALTGSFVSMDFNSIAPRVWDMWFKVDLGITSANTYTFFCSLDGKSWRQMGSATKTTRFTTAADRLGIQIETAVTPLTGEHIHLTIPYWSDNA